MPFDKSKDQELVSLKVGNLNISVMSYNQATPKLQIGPREIEKNDGGITYGKPGRLSKEEFEFILENKDKILEHLN